jgi:serine protease Do
MENQDNQIEKSDIPSEISTGECCRNGGGRSVCRIVRRLFLIVGIVVIAAAAGALGAVYSPMILSGMKLPLLPGSGGQVMETRVVEERVVQEDSLIIDLVEKSSPAVVSIVATKDVPKVRNVGSFGGFPFFFFQDPLRSSDEQGDSSGDPTEKRRVGSGTGFLVSEDGMIVTNKHVVSDESAEYTVLLDGGKEYQAIVLARDPAHDLAVIKIEGSGFQTIGLGDSDSIKVGQTVIAIGNSLGEFSNSVSRGIISGLGRSVTAGTGFGGAETLTDIIQTDAAINPGNSGGPLLDVAGRVIGINVAVAQGAQSVGFAIPVNQIRRTVEDVKATGKISTPYIGVRYAILDEAAQKENSLPFAYGAIVLRGTKPTEFAVIPGSPADKVGIVENDIILEIDGTKIDTEHPLGNIIAKYRPGDEVMLKLWQKGENKDVKVTLEERK